MLRERLVVYRDRARRELTRAFEEEHTPHEVAASFAVGIFVTAMPTGGLGIGLFFLLAYWFSWVSKPAIFASVAVLNPFVKPAVYLVSFHLGAVVLDTGGLIPREETATESVVIGVHPLIIGNLIVAAILSAVSYALTLRLTRVYRRQNHDGANSSLASTAVGLFSRRR